MHATQYTPRLDEHLRRCSTTERIEMLQSLLGDIIRNDCCLKCATAAAAQSLFLYLKDLRDAQNDSEVSRHSHTRSISEAKLFGKGVRREARD